MATVGTSRWPLTHTHALGAAAAAIHSHAHSFVPPEHSWAKTWSAETDVGRRNRDAIERIAGGNRSRSSTVYATNSPRPSANSVTKTGRSSTAISALARSRRPVRRMACSTSTTSAGHTPRSTSAACMVFDGGHAESNSSRQHSTATVAPLPESFCRYGSCKRPQDCFLPTTSPHTSPSEATGEVQWNRRSGAQLTRAERRARR